MKGSRAASRTPDGTPAGVELSLTGLPPPVSQRPGSACAAGPSPGPSPWPQAASQEGGAGGLRAWRLRAINNLRRSNSTTQVPPPWTGSPRPAEPADFLALLEGGTCERRACGEQGATWNVLDEQPRGLTSPARGPASSSPSGPRRRESVLAPSFTANNRSNKGTVGNCVTTMVHNRYNPLGEDAPAQELQPDSPLPQQHHQSGRQQAGEGGSLSEPRKNNSSGSQEAHRAAGLLRRREVTEEEAERFILQVNQAAVTIQRW
ncbi:centrosomal protein of 131 kDa [Perognathus longimembris pacificus]|uniref:centrosomal protein of 131 kDa n=1 Tax=Perognathus longimembris pacificus TaxID=214514 RepID=UPI002019BD2B|nr:centrosomal protein of 131 kDa [Perognathus longimembris pacificus]